MLSLRPLALALAVAISAVLSSGVAVSAGQMPPPDCAYQDVPTKHGAKSEWQITLLDTIYMVPKSYVPPDLVSVSTANIGGGGKVRSIAVDDLRALARAARQANAPLRIVSSYRSWYQQNSLYKSEIRKYGLRRGRQSVARPGHSEHQLGVTIDFGTGGSSKESWQYNDWAKTTSGSWMKQNGWKYGFLLSYPDGKTSTTCYRYEPWHYRYVGREMAAKVRASGLTLREYLWKNYE